MNNKTKLGLIVAFMFIYLSPALGQTYDFSIREDSCTNQEENLFSMRNKSGGHAAEPGHFKWQVCGEGVEEAEISKECSDKTTKMLSMPFREDAHVFSQSDREWNICASFPSSINNSCLSENTIVSLAKKDDSHVAEPGVKTYTLCASQREVETVSLEMKFETSEPIYVDGETAQEKTYSGENLDYSYIVSDDPIGIVSYAETESIKYTTEGSTDILTVKQRNGNFLLPNTDGGHQQIEDKQEEIASREFLDIYSPSFGFERPESPRVRVILDPSVQVEGFDQTVRRNFEMYARHKVDEEPEPVVEFNLN